MIRLVLFSLGLIQMFCQAFMTFSPGIILQCKNAFLELDSVEVRGPLYDKTLRYLKIHGLVYKIAITCHAIL